MGRSGLEQRRRHTAQLAVIAAALALAGLSLVTTARWQDSRAVDDGRVQTQAVDAAERLGNILEAALTTARLRAEGLATTTTMRAAVEAEAEAARDMARAEGFRLMPAARETIELFQLRRGRAPLSLLRAPEGAGPLTIARAEEVRVTGASDAPAGRPTLLVTVTAPVEPLYTHGELTGAVAVATRIDLAPLAAMLTDEGLAAELTGGDQAIALSPWKVPAGVRMVAVTVPYLDRGDESDEAVARAAPRLTLRAAAVSSSAPLVWTGAALLLLALVGGLWALIEHWRRRRYQDEDELGDGDDYPGGWSVPRDFAPTWRTIDENAPLPVPEDPTERELLRPEGNHLVLAWSQPMPTPIPQLLPTHSPSVPMVVDPRRDALGERYRLLRALGRGSASDVYLAQCFVPGAPGTVALKLINHSTAIDRERFLLAARRQVRVVHPNVAQVFDVGTAEVAYVASEYIEGCTLEQLLSDVAARGEALPLAQIVAIVGAVCCALEAALQARDDKSGRAPLVHGAVKPSNVLLGRHNAVKLADFGAPSFATDRQAPEQLAGRPADRRSDVYAVGLIAHELLTNRRLAPAPPEDSKHWLALPAPTSLRGDLPRPVDAVIAKATRLSPRSRYGRPVELLDDLMRATAGAAPVDPHAVLGDWVERARHQR